VGIVLDQAGQQDLGTWGQWFAGQLTWGLPPLEDRGGLDPSHSAATDLAMADLDTEDDFLPTLEEAMDELSHSL
jgi:hypothetical protein